jgi:cell division protein FtsI/penicillin-binding protein 2
MLRSRRGLRAATAVLAALLSVALAQVVAVGAVDPAGWRTDRRNTRTNGWGTNGQRPLWAADGHTPLDAILTPDALRIVRDLLGRTDDTPLGHGWLTRHPPVRPVSTTISVRDQRAVAEAVAGLPAAAVLVDVPTGHVLALAGDLGVGAATTAPPGSIFKLILFGAGLDAGVITADTVFPAETSYAGVTNAGGQAIGGDTVHAVAHSSNTASERVGAALGPARLTDAAHRWGFVAPRHATGFAPAFPDMASLADGQAMTSAVIGQHDTRLNPLYAAAMIAAVANGGTLRTSTVTIDVIEGHRVLDPASAATLRRALRLAVTEGTAHRADLSNLATAAKTGTAQTGLGYDHAWTVAYAPADTPRHAVAVLVAGDPTHSRVGGRDAAPIAARILAATQPTDPAQPPQ